MITGVNSEEGLFTSAAVTANQTKLNQANEQWTSWLSRILTIPEDDEKAKLIRKFYFGNNKNIATKALLTNYTNLFSDHFFFVPAHQHAKLYCDHASIRLYYYTYKGLFSLGHLVEATQGRFPFMVNVFFNGFSRWFRRTVLSENIPHMGTAHADELPLLFYAYLGFGIKLEIKPYYRDFELSTKMVKLWVSFATNEASEDLTYGNLKWLPVSPRDSKFTFLQIDNQPQFVDDPFRERVDFWENLTT